MHLNLASRNSPRRRRELRSSLDDGEGSRRALRRGFPAALRDRHRTDNAQAHLETEEGADQGSSGRRAQVADGVRRAHHPSRGGEPLPAAHAAAPAGDVQGGVLEAAGAARACPPLTGRVTSFATSTSATWPRPNTTGSTSDAGRMVVRLGEPAGIENLSSCGGFRQPEVWSYQSSNGSSSSGSTSLLSPELRSAEEALDPRETGASSRIRASPASTSSARSAGTRGVARAAWRASREEIASRGAAEVFAMGAAPKVSTEGLDALWERLASSSSPNGEGNPR